MFKTAEYKILAINVALSAMAAFSTSLSTALALTHGSNTMPFLVSAAASAGYAALRGGVGALNIELAKLQKQVRS